MITQAAAPPRADTGHGIPALGRLPAGVTAAIDPMVLRDETPAMRDFIARYADALLVAPLPPLDAVVIYYDPYPDAPNQVSFYFLAPAGMTFEEELEWADLLSDREQALADTLPDAEVEILEWHIDLSYSGFIPAALLSGGGPPWFRHNRR